MIGGIGKKFVTRDELDTILRDLLRRIGQAGFATGSSGGGSGSPTFTDLTLLGLTASLPVITDAAKKLVSIAYTGAVSLRKNLGLEPTDEPTLKSLTLSDLIASLPVVTNVNKTLVSQSYANFKASLAIVHEDLGGVSADQHHVQIHASSHHTGGGDLLAHQSIPGSGTLTHATLDSYLDQGVKQAHSPTHPTVKLTDLTDGYIPYHVSDASGLANSGLFWDGTQLGIGVPPGQTLDVNGAIRSRGGEFQLNDGTTTGGGLYFHKTLMGTGADLSPVLFAETGKKLYLAAGGDIALGMVLDTSGNLIIRGVTPQAGYELTVNNDIYAVGDVSALTFTDRTAFFVGDALSEIKNIKALDGQLDHLTLPIFAQAIRKRNIEEEQIITKTRQKTIRVIKQISSEKVKLIKGKYVKVVTIQEQEVDELIFEEYDLYDETGKKILDKKGSPIKHKIPVMEEYQVTEKVKVGEEDVVYRNLGNMVSMLTVAIQQMDARVRALEV